LPVADYDDFDNHRVKHMEMLQAVIGRLGNDSFLIKGWTITVAAAFLGFAVSQDRWQLALASVGPTALFWLLDSTYLRSERLFRDLFDRVRMGEDQEGPFFMGATGDRYVARVKTEARRKGSENIASLWETVRRPALYLFYGAVIAAALLAAIIICRT
jgi:hypothetical protein